jgi:hypothetical protein
VSRVNEVSREVVMIVAGTYQQAERYARDNDIVRWEFVSGHEVLMGLENPRVVYTGTYSARPDIEQIKEMVRTRTRGH